MPFVKYCKGLKRDIEPKHTIKPNGTAQTRVIRKSIKVLPKPVRSDCKAVKKSIIYPFSVKSGVKTPDKLLFIKR